MAGPIEIINIPNFTDEESEKFREAWRKVMSADSGFFRLPVRWWNRSGPELPVIVGEPIEGEEK